MRPLPESHPQLVGEGPVVRDSSGMATNQTLKMDLESLSDDLLLDIMQLVALPPPRCMGPSRQRNDLLPLMRCSRRLYRLGEPILYRKLVAKTPKTLQRFIKTILAHPGLADHVRVVNLDEGGAAKEEAPEVPQSQFRDSSQGFINSFMPRLICNALPSVVRPARKLRHFDDEELEMIEAITLSLSPAKAPSWTEGVRHGTWMPLAAFTLCLLPNVEDLQIEKCQDSGFAKLGQTHNLLSYPFPFANSTSAKLQNFSISYEKRTC